MSRIGKKPITIPEDIKINVKDNKIEINGPRGNLVIDLKPGLEIKMSNKELRLVGKNKTREVSALLGTTRSLIQNAIFGVKEGFEKRLELHGIGFKATKQGNDLVLELGHSHPLVVKPLPGVNLAVEKNIIIVSGINKQQVGEMAARIRKLRSVEPYKGKGIRYQGEIFKKKIGKKAKAALGEGGGKTTSSA